MPQVSRNPTEHATGKLARKIFLIFITISIIPIGINLAVVYRNANWLLRQMSMLDQQRAVVLVIGTLLIVAGLVALAARSLTHPIIHLVQTVDLFTRGGWDQRANIPGKDEIGLLARYFNQIADEMCITQRQLMIQERKEDDISLQESIHLAHIIATSRNLEDLLSDFLDLFVEQFSCSYATIYLLERKEVASATFAYSACIAGSLNLPEDHELSQRLKADRINLDTTPTLDWLVGQAIASQNPQVGTTKGDTGLYEAAFPILQSVEGEDDQVLGVLDIFVTNNDKRLSPFSGQVMEEIKFIVEILALGLASFLCRSGVKGLAATRLERVWSQQKTERQFVELETFWQVSKAISVETDLSALYSLIHRQVEQAMGRISSFGIVLYDSTANQISIPYMIEEGEWLQIPPFPLGKGFSSEIIRTHQPLLMFTQSEIDAKTQKLDAMQVGDPPKSWLGVPMLFGGQVIGLIIVQDVKEEYRFTIQDERLLSMLATQVAVVVRNARLLDATRRQARQERLTNEISDRIRRQVDVQSILKTTTDEISRALGVRRATMRIDTRVVGKDISEAKPDIALHDLPDREVVE